MPKILPWVGERYLAGGIFGSKILLLGESNYDPNGPDRTSDYSKIVIENVHSCVFNGRCAFFTKAAKVLLFAAGAEQIGRDEIESVWNGVAFHNIVQHVFGASRDRPSREMWHEGRQLLLHLLDDLNPELVIVMGRELALNVESVLKGRTWVQIAHPSSFGFKYAPWVQTIKNVLPRIPRQVMPSI